MLAAHNAAVTVSTRGGSASSSGHNASRKSHRAIGSPARSTYGFGAAEGCAARWRDARGYVEVLEESIREPSGR